MEAYKFEPNDIYVEDDIVFSVVHGVPALDVCIKFLDLVAQVSETHGQVIQLVDATEGFGLSPETRRYAAEWGKKHKIAATAVFGASATARAMLSLVMRATNLLTAGSNANTRFFATEAEARAWLDPFRLPAFRRK